MKKIIALLGILTFTLGLASAVFAKGGPAGSPGSGGGGGGGGSEASPDLGDLIIVLRDVNGVPIPSAAGCPLQPLNVLGIPIPLDVECEIIPESECEISGGCLPVEVEFGRTSVARSPETVMEKSFDEVIANIKASKGVSVDPAGRLVLKTEVLNTETNLLEVVYKTIDSPLENLALYVQLMKFGHIQTAEGIISDEHGDEISIRPALDPLVDYVKFSAELTGLLPVSVGSIVAERLTNRDLLFSSFFLAGAADKTGVITVDMVQYLNNILLIPNTTNALPGNSKFVDFRGCAYQRASYFSKSVEVLQPVASSNYWQREVVGLMSWLEYINGTQSDGNNISGFVKSANDSLMVIMFIHNYEIPENLW